MIEEDLWIWDRRIKEIRGSPMFSRFLLVILWRFRRSIQGGNGITTMLKRDLWAREQSIKEIRESLPIPSFLFAINLDLGLVLGIFSSDLQNRFNQSHILICDLVIEIWESEPCIIVEIRKSGLISSDLKNLASCELDLGKWKLGSFGNFPCHALNLSVIRKKKDNRGCEILAYIHGYGGYQLRSCIDIGSRGYRNNHRDVFEHHASLSSLYFLLSKHNLFVKTRTMAQPMTQAMARALAAKGRASMLKTATLRLHDTDMEETIMKFELCLINLQVLRSFACQWPYGIKHVFQYMFSYLVVTSLSWMRQVVYKRNKSLEMGEFLIKDWHIIDVEQSSGNSSLNNKAPLLEIKWEFGLNPLCIKGVLTKDTRKEQRSLICKRLFENDHDIMSWVFSCYVESGIVANRLNGCRGLYRTAGNLCLGDCETVSSKVINLDNCIVMGLTISEITVDYCRRCIVEENLNRRDNSFVKKLGIIRIYTRIKISGVEKNIGYNPQKLGRNTDISWELFLWSLTKKLNSLVVGFGEDAIPMDLSAGGTNAISFKNFFS
ncbi:unnamed protein product [Cochlearia groenlandica]